MEASQQITRKSASNLALAFCLLPKPKRDAMSVLYAYCREVDDIADEDDIPVETRRRQLADWRRETRSAFDGGGEITFDVIRELGDVIREYSLSYDLLDELIKGCEMDLDQTRYANWEELDLYCYRVASVVGLLSIEIFGYREEACREYAVHLGRALQLTNILRDVRVDAGRDRIYLPKCELDAFGVTEAEILEGLYSDRYRAMAERIASRAGEFYSKSLASLPSCDRKSMVAAELMGAVYWELFRKLRSARYNVFKPEPVRVSRAGKIYLIARTWLRLISGSIRPNYGMG